MAFDDTVFAATPSGPEAVDAKAFLGRGLAFPIAVDAEGALQMAAYEEDIAQAVRAILDTSPGERVMRPDFGAGLQALAFEPINTQTLALARHRVEQALVLWEPRIDSLAVVVSARAAAGQLQIDLRYRIRSTNTFYNLVYPFFLQEGRAS
ncbi:GPW/gp25 family protein [Duganella sp. BuS-21]|uniref:GPW/gp25 family protein n=1 Tax=Duganella sp. BuS-21 TaxID=2943848 RepID=UPI0035A62767